MKQRDREGWEKDRKLRWCGFLGVWLLSLIAVSFFGGTLSYGFFFAVTLVPVVCLLYLGAVLFGLRIFQNLEVRKVVAGQPVAYYFVLQNEMPFAFAGVQVQMFSGLFEVEHVPDRLEYELLPGEDYRFGTKLFCKYRGEYKVGVMAVRLTDFLHLFRWSYTLPSTIKATVSPRVVTLPELRSLEDIPSGNSQRSRPGSLEPDVTVRDYASGDSLRHINWKATARTGELKVRQMMEEEKQGIRLYLFGKRCSEKQESYLPLENRMLEIVLAVASTLCEKKVPLQVSYCTAGGSRRIVVQDRLEFEQLYHNMEEYAFRPDAPEGELLQFLEECRREQPRIVFLVLSEQTENLLEATEQLSGEGIYVIVYYVAQELLSTDPGLNRERRKWIVVGTEETLENRL